MNTVQPIRDKNLIRKIETILAEQGTRNLMLFVLGTNSGLRISDILKLTVADVKDKTHIEIHEQKTGKLKKFPINSKLKTLLDNYIMNKEDTDFLFKSKKHGRLCREQAYRIINNACRKAGIKYAVGTHTLRKTFGYWLYLQFKDVAMLQKIFNHSSPSTTLIYIGISQDNIDAVYNNFEI